jgi:hypothetical protein
VVGAFVFKVCLDRLHKGVKRVGKGCGSCLYRSRETKAPRISSTARSASDRIRSINTSPALTTRRKVRGQRDENSSRSLVRPR